MKTIKILIAVMAVILSSGSVAQEVKPKLENKGDLIKATFYYENGNISQKGTYKDGKLHGEWISYGQDGKKNALAKYEEGKKTGKWFFWNKDILTEVDYDNNVIAEVTEYKSTGSLVTRD